MRLLSTISAIASLASLTNAQSAQLQQVNGFNAGPTAAKMHVYLPPNRLAKAPILLAIHYCSGTGPAYFSGTPYARLADTYGFIVIYPTAPSSGTCWDVASTASLTHNGGGDSKTIMNMVAYAVSNYGADGSRVYATGTSSGAMMTHVLAGAYPDIIKGGSTYSGVPDGCFYVQGATAGMSSPGWNTQCANGQLIKSAQQWGDQTRGYYSGYSGPWPKMAIWHGTADTTLRYPNLGEALKQWSNVHQLSFTRNLTNNPENSYTRMEYGDGTKLLGFSAQNVGHSVPVHGDFDLAWFGLNNRNTPTSTTSTTISRTTTTLSRTTTTLSRTTTTLITMTTTSPSPTTSVEDISSSTTSEQETTTSSTPFIEPTTTTTSSAGNTGPVVGMWGQCGGIGWTGGTTCVAGATCKYGNDWYSQCL